MKRQSDTHSAAARPPFRSRDEMRDMLERALRGRRRSLGSGELRAALRRAGVKHPFETGPLWLHDFEFSAVPDMVPAARRRVAEFCGDCGLAGEPHFDLVLAVGEALANAVEHGSPRGAQDMVSVRVGIIDESVAVQVHDSGRGFTVRPASLEGSLESRGRGIPFMRSLVDKVTFTKNGRGTVVLLVKSAA